MRAILIFLLPWYHSLVRDIYLPVPAENKTPIEWVNPIGIQEMQRRDIMQWDWEVSIVLENYPESYRMLILGIIAQESQGLEQECQQWRDEVCGVGLMAITPREWTGTVEELSDPLYNIYTGAWMLDGAMKRAIEYGFRPGRDATRAALAAFNCGFTSLLANKCASFGGFVYADVILNYWIPLLNG